MLFSKRTLRANLTIFIMGISTATAILLCVFVYFRLTGYIRHENTLYVENMTRSIGESVDMMVRQVDQNSRTIVSYIRVQDILTRAQQPGYSEIEFIADRAELSYLWVSFSNTGEDLVVFCYDKDGEVLFYKDGAMHGKPKALFENDWLRENRPQLDSRKFSLVSGNRLDAKMYGKLMPYMVIRPLTDFTGGKPVAYVAIYADADRMRDILSVNKQLLDELHKNASEPTIHVLDSQGEVMVSTETSAVGKIFAEEQGQVYYRCLSDYSGLETVLMLDRNFYRSGTNSAVFEVALLFLLLVVFTGIIASVVINHRLAPLRELSRHIDLVRAGDFETKLDSGAQADSDIEFLFLGFNHMLDQTSSLIENVSSQKLLMKSIELQNLKYQINPHFLYNTLQTVEAIGELNDLPELMTISHALGRMFRYNLEPRNLVLMHEEISHLQFYFTIEKIRFQELIRFEIDVPRELKELGVLKFIFQPIVENAIHHGFRRVDGVFVVGLRAYTEDGSLCIEITDNGIGIEADRLKEIRRRLEEVRRETAITAGEDDSDSIGIINVQRRIINFFGNGCGLEYKSSPGHGTRVLIRLPIRRGRLGR